MAIPQHHTNLRRSCALLRELADLVNDLLGCGLEPCWWCPGVWDSGRRDTLAVGMETTHICGIEIGIRSSLSVLPFAVVNVEPMCGGGI